MAASPRLCHRCGEQVFNHQPALVNHEGTAHIGGCDPGAVEAMARMKAAFLGANAKEVRV